MKKKVLVAILCVLTAISFMACSNETPDSTSDGDKPVNAGESKTYDVKLYFANEDYVATGDESLQMLYPIDWQLTAKEGEQYKDVLDIGLREVPKKNADADKNYTTGVTDNIQFNSVTVKDGTAAVDLKGEGLTGGSLEEMILVRQIVETLTGSFKEVKDVQFLVDGKVKDSLMGHMDTSKPLRSELTNKK